MKRTVLSFLVLVFVAFFINAQTVPVPSAYYNFNTDWFTTDNHNAIPLDMGTKVDDDSGNGLFAAWYNYNSEFPSLYSGFKAGEGKFNGAAYFGGYKSLCNGVDDEGKVIDNSPAAARDVLFFAGNASKKAYASNVIDTSSVWQGVRKSFTIAYWWKSDKELTSNYTNACPPDENPDWGEEETHFDGGAFNGIDIICWYNYYKIGWRNGSDGVDESHQSDWFMPADGNVPEKGDWIHVAVTFDGSTGLLTLYLNGEPAVDFDGNESGNPNPIQTGYTQFDAVTFDEDVVHTARGAVLFGATNGASPSGKNSGGEFWGEVPQYEGKFGYIEDHYRMGWAARGYLDEFAYWRDVALTKDQIQYIMSNEIEGLISTGILNHKKADSELMKISPNPSEGSVTIKINNNTGGMLSVVNMTGAVVYQQVVEPTVNVIDLNLSLSKGLYIVKFESEGHSSFSKLIVK